MILSQVHACLVQHCIDCLYECVVLHEVHACLVQHCIDCLYGCVVLHEVHAWSNTVFIHTLVMHHVSPLLSCLDIIDHLFVPSGWCVDPQNGYTALMFAGMKGMFDTVQALLTAGADVNAKDNVSVVVGATWIVKALKKN